MVKFLKLDKAGNPIKWIDHEKAIHLYATDRVIASLGQETFLFHGGDNAVSGKHSQIEVGSILLTRSRVRTHTLKDGYAPHLSNKALFRRDGSICMYCGNPFMDYQLTRDHVMPTSRGGLNHWANVVCACKRCNNRKDDRTPEEAGMPLLGVPFVPSHFEWLVLDNRKILGDQTDFLKARCPRNSRIWH